MRIFGFFLFSFSREVSLICFENVSKQKCKQFKELAIWISFRKKTPKFGVFAMILVVFSFYWLKTKVLSKAQYNKNKQNEEIFRNSWKILWRHFAKNSIDFSFRGFCDSMQRLAIFLCTFGHSLHHCLYDWILDLRVNRGSRYLPTVLPILLEN